MTDKDIVVGSTSIFPTGPQAKLVPHYLVKLEPELGSKSKSYRLFIAIETMNLNADFIHVKGFYTTSTEEDIVSGYREVVAGFPVSDKLEIWLPWHTIHSIRSLTFKTANK